MQTAHCTRAKTHGAPWPFGALTEQQHRARAQQEAHIRRLHAQQQHRRVLACFAAFAAASLAGCGGGGDFEDDTPAARVPTPTVQCAASSGCRV